MFHRWMSTGNENEDSCIECGITVERNPERSDWHIKVEDARSIVPCKPHDGPNHHMLFVEVEDTFDVSRCGFCGVETSGQTSPADFPADCIEQ